MRHLAPNFGVLHLEFSENAVDLYGCLGAIHARHAVVQQDQLVHGLAVIDQGLQSLLE